jgi:hypothetical protein
MLPRSLRTGPAALLALALWLSPSAAQSADLDYRTPPSERYGTAYADPRYADIYGYRPAPPPYGPPAHVPPRYDGYAHPGYGPPRAPLPHEPVYRHPRYEAYPPPPAYGPKAYGPPRYEEPRRHAGRSPGCLPKDVIERELVQDGWRDFHAPEVLSQHEAHIRARRPDGRLFQLRVDRCSGEIVAARPLFERDYGPRTYGGYGPRAY